MTWAVSSSLSGSITGSASVINVIRAPSSVIITHISDHCRLKCLNQRTSLMKKLKNDHRPDCVQDVNLTFRMYRVLTSAVSIDYGWWNFFSVISIYLSEFWANSGYPYGQCRAAGHQTVVTWNCSYTVEHDHSGAHERYEYLSSAYYIRGHDPRVTMNPQQLIWRDRWIAAVWPLQSGGQPNSIAVSGTALLHATVKYRSTHTVHRLRSHKVLYDSLPWISSCTQTTLSLPRSEWLQLTKNGPWDDKKLEKR